MVLLKMMIKLKNEGFINEEEANHKDFIPSKLTIEEIVAQAFV